jgi:hypothetical protein
MWLCTQSGFFSIVQKQPGEFHVRARLKEDLENLRLLCVTKAPLEAKLKTDLKKFGNWKIHRSVDADYRWRMVITQPDVIWIMACLADSIDYSNFKSRIHDLPDQKEKSSAYSQLWANLHALQQ